MLPIIGWVAWTFSAYLALTWAYSCRRMVRSGQSFQWATAVQTFFCWVIAVVFLFSSLNKLHILWLLPVLFFGAQFLVLAGVPILTPVVLFLTQIFMKLVLVGTGASAQSSAIVWENLLKGMEEDEKCPKEIKQIVSNFLIPDNISPNKFLANWIALFRHWSPSRLDDGQNVNPTPSLQMFSFVTNRPLGYPEWFLAAYPDVASWVTACVEEDENVFREIFDNISEDPLLDNRRLKDRYLRTLIDTYRKETGRRLECSE